MRPTPLLSVPSPFPDRRAQACPRVRHSRLGLIVFGLLLAGCSDSGVQPSASLRMFDCVFQSGKHVHLHISESEARASLITDYRRGTADSHAGDLRAGRESKGRLEAAAGGRLVIAMFLLNDHFGESAGETVSVHLAADGRTRFEARGSGGQTRTIDAGTCSPVGHQPPLSRR